MKIGIFSNFYPPSERGGAELIAARVAHEFSRRGHDVFVLSTMSLSRPGDLRVHRVEAAVERVYRFFPLNTYHISRAGWFPLPVRLLWHLVDLHGPLPHRQIDRLLQDEQPEVIFTHNLKGLGVRAARCIQKAGIRHIHTVHDVQLSIPSGVLNFGEEDAGLNRGMVRMWYEQMAMHALGRPDVVISPSHFLADFYRARGFFAQTRMEVIANPAPSGREVNPLRKESSGPLRLLFVGQLEPHKGVRLLLEAVRGLDVPYELHLAGEGSLAREVLRETEKNRHLFSHGFISLEHIRNLMSGTDAVVLPSLCYENSPTVIYESFQSGVPVIASRIGGIPELVEDGQNGLLFEPGRVESLREALQRFARERGRFFARHEEIRQNAEAYSLARYMSRLESFF